MNPDSLPWFAEESWLPWLDLLGRLHPLLVHMPLGVLPVLVVLEAWGLVRRKPLDKGVRRGLVSMSALAAVSAALAGWLLAEEPSYGGADLELHRKLGIGLAGANLLAMLAAWTGVLKVYGWALVVAFGLLLPAGHQGGSMVHGDDFVRGPLLSALDGERYEPTSAAPPASAVPAEPSADPGLQISASLSGDAGADHAVATDDGSDYAETIAPLLATRCGNCHGERRQRGALALHTPEDILAGGEFGPALIVGDGEASEMVRRMRLPLDHEDHMPPEGKTQPTPDEVDALALWIESGAPFTGRVPLSVARDERFAFDVDSGASVALSDPSAATGAESDGVSAPGPVVPDPVAIAALAAQLVHVEVLDPQSGLLWLDFAAYPTADDAALSELLPPLSGCVAELSLAGTALTDGGLAHVAGLEGLKALDLRRTAVTADGLTSLAALTDLQTLNLTSTALDAAAVDLLSTLPALQRVHLYDSGLDADAFAQLTAARPELQVFGDTATDIEPLEVEPEVEFVAYVEAGSSDEPAPADLAPINTTCPVSGGPVDPRYVVVHDGRAIGFCCNMCPSTFWADPAAYAVDE